MSTYPIIYVRGYAMTEAERDETAADPFCGFNVGSTVYRASADAQQRPEKFVFESPVLRLVTEYQYRHVYQNGADILDPDWQPPVRADGTRAAGIPPESIIIYRYYDSGSGLFGDGKARTIETYAAGLSDLIIKVRELVCQWVPEKGKPMQPDDFRCYLVAHSMGGLVARAFLQNKALGAGSQQDGKSAELALQARKSVDKLFTFATPHNGIEVMGLNVPSWLTASEANTFNRERMAEFLDMKAVAQAHDGRVDFMPEDVLSSDRIFCMVGTNRGDYEVLQGAVRAFVGHGSDGLVRVANASLWGVDPKTLQTTQPVATAYTYRSHSGNFGIVNSEEAYQNLVRFLFGDIRVDIWLDIEEVHVPASLDGVDNDKIDGLYQFELLAAARGKRWFLSRRVAEEDSPAVRTHKQLTSEDSTDKSIYLSTVFLSNRARVNMERPSLAYAMTIATKVPDYQVEKRFWPDQHYEGGNLFRDTAIIELTAPQAEDDDWLIRYNWLSKGDAVATKKLKYKELSDDGRVQLEIPFENAKKPGIKGKIRLVVRPWNASPVSAKG